MNWPGGVRSLGVLRDSTQGQAPPLFMNSIILQTFIEYLLCAEYCIVSGDTKVISKPDKKSGEGGRQRVRGTWSDVFYIYRYTLPIRPKKTASTPDS